MSKITLLKVGSKVVKTKGTPFHGTVVALYHTTRRELRAVVEHPEGWQHIFAPDQLRPIDLETGRKVVSKNDKGQWQIHDEDRQDSLKTLAEAITDDNRHAEILTGREPATPPVAGMETTESDWTWLRATKHHPSSHLVSDFDRQRNALQVAADALGKAILNDHSKGDWRREATFVLARLAELGVKPKEKDNG
jgi:hypothetical protein